MNENNDGAEEEIDVENGSLNDVANVFEVIENVVPEIEIVEEAVNASAFDQILLLLHQIADFHPFFGRAIFVVEEDHDQIVREDFCAVLQIHL